MGRKTFRSDLHEEQIKATVESLLRLDEPFQIDAAHKVVSRVEIDALEVEVRWGEDAFK